MCCLRIHSGRGVSGGPRHGQEYEPERPPQVRRVRCTSSAASHRRAPAASSAGASPRHARAACAAATSAEAWRRRAPAGCAAEKARARAQHSRPRPGQIGSRCGGASSRRRRAASRRRLGQARPPSRPPPAPPWHPGQSAMAPPAAAVPRERAARAARPQLGVRRLQPRWPQREAQEAPPSTPRLPPLIASPRLHHLPPPRARPPPPPPSAGGEGASTLLRRACACRLIHGGLS